jgi:hypothetical protein
MDEAFLHVSTWSTIDFKLSINLRELFSAAARHAEDEQTHDEL